jgi:hypothetical protein
MDLLVTISGDLSLSETESRCEVEQNEGFQLDNIKFGTVIAEGKVFQVNKAEFNLESSLKILNDLSFVAIGPGANPDDVKKKKITDEGMTFICDSQIYVTGKLSRVMVFGKKV